MYAITSLGWDEVTPEQLARLVRGHWSIDHRVHYAGPALRLGCSGVVRPARGPVLAIGDSETAF